MINNPIVQKPLSKTNDNYGEIWYNTVRAMVEDEYKNITNFINAYGNNPNKVLQNLNSIYKIVPFDLKNTLQNIYNEITTIRAA